MRPSSPPLPELTERQVAVLANLNGNGITCEPRTSITEIFPGFSISGLDYSYICCETKPVITCIHQSEIIITPKESPLAYHFNVKDKPETQILAEFDQIRDWIDAHRAADRPVHIMCMAGLNRSATIAVAYLCYAKKMDVVSAYRYLYAKRHGIIFNPYFKCQLIRWADENGYLDPSSQDQTPNTLCE
jgi:hypothetical protein